MESKSSKFLKMTGSFVGNLGKQIVVGSSKILGSIVDEAISPQAGDKLRKAGDVTGNIVETVGVMTGSVTAVVTDKAIEVVKDIRDYDEHGFNKEGYNREGYDFYGYNQAGYDQKGYDKDGYDLEGYNAEGYDKQGYHKEGITVEEEKLKVAAFNNLADYESEVAFYEAQKEAYRAYEERASELVKPYIKIKHDGHIHKSYAIDQANEAYKALEKEGNLQYKIINKILVSSQSVSQFSKLGKYLEENKMEDTTFVLAVLLTRGSILAVLEGDNAQNELWQCIAIKLEYDKRLLKPTDFTKAVWIKMQSYVDRIGEMTNELATLTSTLYPETVQYFSELCFMQQLLAVRQDPISIQWMKEPAFEIQMLAVQSDPSTIRWIKAPLPVLQKLAVEKDYETIRYIKSPSHEVQLKWLEALQEQNITDYTALAHAQQISFKVQQAISGERAKCLRIIKNMNVIVQCELAKKVPDKFLNADIDKDPRAMLIALKAYMELVKSSAFDLEWLEANYIENGHPLGYYSANRIDYWALGRYESYEALKIDYNYIIPVLGIDYDMDQFCKRYYEEAASLKRIEEELLTKRDDWDLDYYMEDTKEYLDEYDHPGYEPTYIEYDPSSDTMVEYNSSGQRIGHY